MADATHKIVGSKTDIEPRALKYIIKRDVAGAVVFRNVNGLSTTGGDTVSMGSANSVTPATGTANPIANIKVVGAAANFLKMVTTDVISATLLTPIIRWGSYTGASSAIIHASVTAVIKAITFSGATANASAIGTGSDTLGGTGFTVAMTATATKSMASATATTALGSSWTLGQATGAVSASVTVTGGGNAAGGVELVAVMNGKTTGTPQVNDTTTLMANPGN